MGLSLCVASLPRWTFDRLAAIGQSCAPAGQGSPGMMDAPLHPVVDPARRAAAGAVVQDDYDLDTPWHRHDMHQLQYAFDGAIEVEDARARHLLPRELAAWIPAGVAHRTSLHRVRSGSVLFAPHMVESAGDRVRIVEVPPLMRAMVLGAMRWPLGSQQDSTGRAYFATLGLLCTEWIQREAPLSLPTAADPAVRAAMAFTRAHLAAADLAAVSAAAGLSERTLRRRFRTEVGMSWEAWRRRARLLAGIALLNGTARPVGAIGAEVGFESQSAFARALFRLTGRTPRAFRRS
jgi:AraC-like DNA-binding protein